METKIFSLRRIAGGWFFSKHNSGFCDTIFEEYFPIAVGHEKVKLSVSLIRRNDNDLKVRLLKPRLFASFVKIDGKEVQIVNGIDRFIRTEFKVDSVKSAVFFVNVTK